MTANVKEERMHDRCGLKRGKGYVLRRESWGTNGVGRRVGVCKQLKVNERTFDYLLNKTIKITNSHFLTNKLSYKL